MRYFKVVWRHDHPDEPTTLYSECDDEGWETRKVEVFQDARLGHASPTRSAGGTRLNERKLPGLDEIASQSEFSPVHISALEFETVWSTAQTHLRDVA